MGKKVRFSILLAHEQVTTTARRVASKETSSHLLITTFDHNFSRFARVLRQGLGPAFQHCDDADYEPHEPSASQLQMHSFARDPCRGNLDSVFMQQPQAHSIIVSTWSFGQFANRAAWPVLEKSGDALDAAVIGAMHAEDDLTNHTVGTGGYPDASGRVTCDAAVMRSPDAHGAVACISDVRHPILVARQVMEHSPHRLLVGAGALAFARAQGHAHHDLLTGEARQAYQQWKATSEPIRLANLEDQIGVRRNQIGEANHDTIGLIAIDAAGNLAAAVTTSGLAFKMPGRVGDSPIAGCGLYCVPGVGAAVCTGRGELVQGTCASFLAVELLRQGMTASDAALTVIRRIRDSHTLGPDDQVGIIVMDASGRSHAASLMSGFRYAIKTHDRDELIDAEVG